MMLTGEAVRAINSTVSARHAGVEARFLSVFTDSRAVEPGGLFVALRGDRFDGHAFVGAALAGGAHAAMVDERAPADALIAGSGAKRASLIVVRDTRAGLAALAGHWRRRFALPVIGVVGSNGKTTTKEMIARILNVQFGVADVLATVGNLNNDIGVPLTLLRLRERHRAAVIEIGMNHPGETALLAAIAQPTIGLINNAQREHQEFMHSVAEVAAEHGALISALPGDGVAVINADDEYAHYWRGLAGRREVRDFGLGKARVHASYRAAADCSALEIRLPEGEVRTSLAVPGVHNVRNALAAAAAASAAGAMPAAIGQGLADFIPVKGRLQVKRAANELTVIDDTYNANPDSVRAAIDVLAGAAGTKLLVLGDMGEVGAQGEAFHREVGRYAAERGIDVLVATGEASEATIAAFGARGRHRPTIDAVLAEVRALLDGRRGATVLVKGSRFMRMERVVDALCQGMN